MPGVEVKIKNIKKSFNEREILRGISFNCKKGESVVILGESGMGKSVLMRIIGTFLEADSGSIKIGEQEIVGITDKKKERVMSNIGFLFQYSGLFEHLTVWQNIMFYQLYIEKRQPEAMRDEALRIMEILKIPLSTSELKPNQISGGMQRRVALARTIIKKPSLILLDEPTTGLDPVVCKNVNNAINDVKHQTGATMITITHDLNSALQTGERIVVLKDGQIIWDGKPYDIFSCKDEYVKAYLQAAVVNPS